MRPSSAFSKRSSAKAPRAPYRHSRSTSHSQTTTCAGPVSGCVTITLPTHPLQGVQLPVIRTARSQDGRRYVDVEHPPGWCMRLPIEWTDRSSPQVPPSIGGREVRLGISALLKLADAVEVALRQEHTPPPASDSAAKHSFIHVTSSSPSTRTALVNTARGNPTGPPRSVDDPPAQNASRRGRKRGGKR
jgi:hypothetical protein